MGSYLVMYGKEGESGEALLEQLARDLPPLQAAIRFSWTGEGEYPAAALVMVEDDAVMEQLAERHKTEGVYDFFWLGAGQDGTGIGGGGSNDGHIKAGRGGGHIKAGQAGA